MRKIVREDPGAPPGVFGLRDIVRDDAHRNQNIHGIVAEVGAKHGVEGLTHCVVGGDPAELRVTVERVIWR